MPTCNIAIAIRARVRATSTLSSRTTSAARPTRERRCDRLAIRMTASAAARGAPPADGATAGEIVKSANDRKEYRRIMLPNQMNVLLISDPEVAELLNQDDEPESAGGAQVRCRRLSARECGGQTRLGDWAAPRRATTAGRTPPPFWHLSRG